MGKGIGSLIGAGVSAASSGKGGGGGGGGGQLTAQEEAMLAYQAQSEAKKETAAYTDYGIPYSTGLAHDLGSIGFQTAAEAGSLQQSQYNANLAAQTAQSNQLGNALGNLGTALGTSSAGTTGGTTGNTGGTTGGSTTG